MDTLKKYKLSIWKSLLKYYAGLSEHIKTIGDFTFPPSGKLIEELEHSFSRSSIECFENGPGFSSYEVFFSTGGKTGQAIYKTTAATYPLFQKYNTLEDYNRSFK